MGIASLLLSVVAARHLRASSDADAVDAVDADDAQRVDSANHRCNGDCWSHWRRRARQRELTLRAAYNNTRRMRSMSRMSVRLRSLRAAAGQEKCEQRLPR